MITIFTILALKFSCFLAAKVIQNVYLTLSSDDEDDAHGIIEGFRCTEETVTEIIKEIRSEHREVFVPATPPVGLYHAAADAVSALSALPVGGGVVVSDLVEAEESRGADTGLPAQVSVASALLHYETVNKLDVKIAEMQRSGRDTDIPLVFRSRQCDRMAYALASAAQRQFSKYTLDNDQMCVDMTRANYAIVRKFMRDELSVYRDLRDSDAVLIIDIAMTCVKYVSLARKRVAHVEATYAHATACQEVRQRNSMHHVMAGIGIDVNPNSCKLLQRLCGHVPNLGRKAHSSSA